jgi:hypothetical protein
MYGVSGQKTKNLLKKAIEHTVARIGATVASLVPSNRKAVS